MFQHDHMLLVQFSSVKGAIKTWQKYNAAVDGAASVMVTGETAVGEYPVDVIRYLKKTVETV